MIKVSGLPVNITKSDLDELFEEYGIIQITKNSLILKIEKDETWAFLELLDENEQIAIEELNHRKHTIQGKEYTIYVAAVQEISFDKPKDTQKRRPPNNDDVLMCGQRNEDEGC
ncbi:RNA-binding protein [Limnoraphis robusta Tam1]|uniref:RNA-binding protein n=1 Tax=Limnoraphis robusta TaxID=1118279 RepID=UPI002B1F5498|nr:RNA-binding protein [Limnoraphis robusta]MEA5541489.1 RNA-binding protein [Limnoraphis robusta Tam1]